MNEVKQSDYPEIFAFTKLGFLWKLYRAKKNGWRLDENSKIDQFTHHSAIVHKPKGN